MGGLDVPAAAPLQCPSMPKQKPMLNMEGNAVAQTFLCVFPSLAGLRSIQRGQGVLADSQGC